MYLEMVVFYTVSNKQNRYSKLSEILFCLMHAVVLIYMYLDIHLILKELPFLDDFILYSILYYIILLSS